MPAATSTGKIAALLAALGGIGGAFGWKWGASERVPKEIGGRAKQLVLSGIGFLTGYIALDSGLPQIGRWFPAIYEDWSIFWSLVTVRGVVWAFTVGTFTRLFVLLNRRAALA